MILSMVAGIIVARLLGPELRGYWGLVLLAIQTISLGNLGLGPSVMYHTGKMEGKRDKILTFTIASSLLLGFVLITVFFYIYPHVLKTWNEIPRSVMLIGLIAVPFTFLFNFYRQFLMGMLRIMQSNIMEIMRGFLYLILVMILIWGLNGKVRAITLCFTLSIIAACMLSLLLFSRDIKPARITDPSFLSPFFRYGFKAYMIIVFAFLNYRIDIFLIKHFLTASDVAFYQIAVNISERLWYIPNALSYTLLPTLLSMQKGSSKFTARVCRNSLFVMLFFAVILVVAGKFVIVLLYGEAYLPAALALYSVIWGIVIITVYKVLGAYFSSENRLGITIFAAFVGIVVNVLANLYLIPRYGIVGAGIATSLSYTVLCVIVTAFFLRLKDMTLREMLIPNREDFESYREALRKGLNRIRGARGKSDDNTAPPHNQGGQR